MASRLSGAPFGRIKVLTLEEVGIDLSARAIAGYASTMATDRENEIIHPEAFSPVLERYLRNPILTWMHMWDEPIGRILEARVEPRGLWFRACISERTQRARDTWGLIQDGVLSAVSVGFDGLYTAEFGHRDARSRWHWTAIADLYEIAIVTIPANPDATFRLAKCLGLSVLPASGSQPSEEGGRAGTAGGLCGASDGPSPVESRRVWRVVRRREE